MMTATLATGSLLLALGCGNAPSATATNPAAERPVVTSANSTGATTPAAAPSPTKPKGHTITPRKVRWEKAKPSRDGRRLKIVWWSGVEPCNVLDRVKVRETAKTVTVTLYEGRARGSRDVACIQIAIQKTTTVKLKAPLGKRKIVDGARR
ncbi:hypothetical protein GCM10022226_09240 [Sphaerisporangium flaviroseum]|uniref:Uncharacterized protein n=1 Tax=Sphaerisporangium flaviroseum TaxID=509199 RepID=A0ABP7HEB3_9ACTN